MVRFIAIVLCAAAATLLVSLAVGETRRRPTDRIGVAFLGVALAVVAVRLAMTWR